MDGSFDVAVSKAFDYFNVSIRFNGQLIGQPVLIGSRRKFARIIARPNVVVHTKELPLTIITNNGCIYEINFNSCNTIRDSVKFVGVDDV